MKFNTITICFMLWGAVGFVTMVLHWINLMRLKKRHRNKLLYMQRLLEMAASGKSPANILKELYYSFVDDKYLRKLLFKAMKQRPVDGFRYIYKAIGCYPMAIIHHYLIDRERNIKSGERLPIPQDTIKSFWKQIAVWDEQYNRSRKDFRNRKVKLILGKNMILLINLYAYLALRTDISLMIFAVVNTIGIVVGIVLDYECCNVDRIVPEGKLARAKKKTHLPAKGIQNAFQLAAGLGLIINIATVAAGWLGPVA